MMADIAAQRQAEAAAGEATSALSVDDVYTVNLKKLLKKCGNCI